MYPETQQSEDLRLPCVVSRAKGVWEMEELCNRSEVSRVAVDHLNVVSFLEIFRGVISRLSRFNLDAGKDELR